MNDYSADTDDKAQLLELTAKGESSGVEFEQDDLRSEQIAKGIVTLANLRIPCPSTASAIGNRLANEAVCSLLAKCHSPDEPWLVTARTNIMYWLEKACP